MWDNISVETLFSVSLTCLVCVLLNFYTMPLGEKVKTPHSLLFAITSWLRRSKEREVCTSFLPRCPFIIPQASWGCLQILIGGWEIMSKCVCSFMTFSLSYRNFYYSWILHTCSD